MQVKNRLIKKLKYVVRQIIRGFKHAMKLIFDFLKECTMYEVNSE